MSPSRRSALGLARLYRSHSCTARPAVRQSALRRSSFAVIAKSGAVIASEAKQSILSLRLYRLLRCARNDGNSRRTYTFSPRHAPEPLINLPPKEGVGNAGCPWHPQPRVRFALVKSTRVNEYPGITRRSRTQWF